MKLDDDIHNYYEHLILERIEQLGLHKNKTSDYMADLCCLALNQVPPRYIRYEVDMAFYLPQLERHQMVLKAQEAVDKSVEILNRRDEEDSSS
jgi:hypothetical protein